MEQKPDTKRVVPEKPVSILFKISTFQPAVGKKRGQEQKKSKLEQFKEELKLYFAILFLRSI